MSTKRCPRGAQTATPKSPTSEYKMIEKQYYKKGDGEAIVSIFCDTKITNVHVPIVFTFFKLHKSWLGDSNIWKL